MSKPKIVLVVEDECLIAMEIQAELEDVGWTVIGPASTASQAIELARQNPLSVSVLDITLGGSQSFEVAEILDQQNIPFVFLSGHSSSFVPEKFRARTLLSKPIRFQELFAALEREL